MSGHSYIKAYRIRRNAWRRVRARLERWRDSPPHAVNVITDWSAQRDGRDWAVVTEQPWQPWPNLGQALPHLHCLEKRLIADQLLAMVGRWREEGFVHGDLSPQNLLLLREGGHSPRILAVDWVMDLESREGTPRYVPEHLAWLLKTHEHDRAAARLIAAELGHRPV
jgi:hypothetical protein